MRILAIDPGPKLSAWIVYDDGKIIAFAHEPNATLLCRLFEPSFNFDTRTEWHPIKHLAIEMIANMGMAAVGAEIFETVLWIGRYIQAFDPRPDSPSVTKVYRLEEKITLCGNAKAKDPNIRQALIDRFGGDSVAIGGKKCQTCKGRGSTKKVPCETCGATGWQHPPGPLTGIAGDVWSALAVAITFTEKRKAAA